MRFDTVPDQAISTQQGMEHDTADSVTEASEFAAAAAAEAVAAARRVAIVACNLRL